MYTMLHTGSMPLCTICYILDLQCRSMPLFITCVYLLLLYTGTMSLFTIIILCVYLLLLYTGTVCLFTTIILYVYLLLLYTGTMELCLYLPLLYISTMRLCTLSYTGTMSLFTSATYWNCAPLIYILVAAIQTKKLFKLCQRYIYIYIYIYV
jgi:hypothetical protein